MELYNIADKNKYEVNIPSGSGEYYTQCPVCSHNRKRENQKKRCFSWNRDKKIGNCFNCESKFVEYRDLGVNETTSFIPPPQALPQPLNNSYIPLSYLNRSLGKESNFVEYLSSVFKEDDIVNIMNQYKLGMTKNGSVIYWYIDRDNNLRSGKIMQYNAISGKRIKDGYSVDWVHSKLKKEDKLPPDWTLSRCLYGEHLLSTNADAKLCLVESEKTAIIASIFQPAVIWLATGGKGSFNSKVCQSLGGRNVEIFPDLGATQEWSDKVTEISDTVGCKMIINDVLEKQASPEQRERGCDIADFLLNSYIPTIK